MHKRVSIYALASHYSAPNQNFEYGGYRNAFHRLSNAETIQVPCRFWGKLGKEDLIIISGS